MSLILNKLNLFAASYNKWLFRAQIGIDECWYMYSRMHDDMLQ